MVGLSVWEAFRDSRPMVAGLGLTHPSVRLFGMCVISKPLPRIWRLREPEYAVARTRMAQQRARCSCRSRVEGLGV
jgi:hypothetical protein